MTRREFKCWFPMRGETEDEAVDCLNCIDAGMAAEEAVSGRFVGPDWDHLIGGDPVRVEVLDPETGERWLFSVQVSCSIDYTALEVDEGDDGHEDCEVLP